MAVIYRMSKDTRKHTAHPGKWFPRPVNLGTIETDQLARLVQRNCSVKRSDVVAVLIELSEVIQQLLRDSHRVRLDGFGSFKIGLNSKGARTAKSFTVADHIEGMHVVFTPERTHDAAGNRVKQFLQGVKCEELPENKVEKEDGE